MTNSTSTDSHPPAPSRFFLRYDEIGLKGGSRPMFERKLRNNVVRLLGLKRSQVQRIRGRLVVELKEGDDPKRCTQALQRCFGLRRISPVVTMPGELAAIEEAACRMAKEEVAAGRRSFKVESRRKDKTFPMRSFELSAHLGAVILDACPELGVDVHKPDFILRVELFPKPKPSYMFCRNIDGPGGLPVGAGGRALLLLSGGIDSPVAGWFGQKRGLSVDAIYFHSFPYTGEGTKDKVKELVRVLSRSSPGPMRLYVASMTAVQKAIQEKVPQQYWTVMLRRMMFRVADEVAERRKLPALITGDCLGQVASQTLANLNATEGVARRILLRPLLGFDKHEVIDRAKAIGSYDISIQPFQDCCSLFAPDKPTTKARREDCERFETGLDLEGLVAGSIAAGEIYRVSPEGASLIEDGLQRMLDVETATEVIPAAGPLEPESP